MRQHHVGTVYPRAWYVPTVPRADPPDTHCFLISRTSPRPRGHHSLLQVLCEQQALRRAPRGAIRTVVRDILARAHRPAGRRLPLHDQQYVPPPLHFHPHTL